MLATRSARWTVGTALGCVMIMVAAWFALITPRRDEADAVRAQAVSAQVEAQQLQVKIAQLKAQYAELPLRKAELAGILKQMPPTSQMPDLLRSLTSLSEAAGVDFVSVAPSSPTYLMVAPTGAPAAAVATGSATSGSSSASSSSSAAPAATSATAAATVPSRVILTPIVVTVTGEFLQTVTYLQKLQTQAPRAFLIVGLQVSPDSTKAHQVRMVISGRVFSLPTDDTAATSGAGRGTTGTGTTGTGTTGTTATTPSSGSTPAIAAGQDEVPTAPRVSRIGNADSHGQVTS